MIQIRTIQTPRHATSMNIGKNDLDAYISGYNVGENVRSFRLACSAIRKSQMTYIQYNMILEEFFEYVSRFYVTPPYIPSDQIERIMFDFGVEEGRKGKSTLAKISELVDLIVVD